METMTLKEYLLGGLDTTLFLACLIFAAIGVLISLLIEATERNVETEKSPRNHSWGYLWSHHWKRVLLVMLLIYASIIFTPQLFGITLNTFVALMLGLGFKYLLKYVKKARSRFFADATEKTKKKK